STGKYNFVTFLPLFLFEQFRKIFNIFFLIICILQQIPGISPTGKYTTIVPLAFILTVAAIKETVEDYKRHKADGAVNNRKVEIFRDGRFVELAWTEVVVGDIVKVVSGKFFPADLVLLSSSEPQAMCYIETANLDGETNLKIRQVSFPGYTNHVILHQSCDFKHRTFNGINGLPATSKIQSTEDMLQVRGMIECETPNRNLYSFTGSIKLHDDRLLLLPLGPDQILLRGAMLRNTKWIYGVVVYTGHESKLMKNANRAPLKMSNVDRTTNMQIWFLMAILLVISLASAIGSEVWKKETTKRWYLNDTGTGAKGFFMELLTFIILYNNLVPISLLVTLEVVKFIQAIFINSDLDMYHEETDTPAMARTSNLNEELGQVKYIFSDKTGTLTENIMEFKKCSIGGVKYGVMNYEQTAAAGWLNINIAHPNSNSDFYDEAFIENLQTNVIRDFLTMMSVCHTVVPERASKYQSSSPDENAIVRAARNLGFVFCVRTPTHVVVRANGKEDSYEVLNVLEFNSTRKRMSVIVRAPDGRILLMCKGADNVIYERLSDKSQFLFETENHLRDYAQDGLRTLCFAQAVLDEADYKVWNDTVYYEASTAVIDRDIKLAHAYEAIEKNLFLLGASAIEDKLQQGVPETIATLAKADIKIWVLTGDKQETAINIAYSTHLINNEMALGILGGCWGVHGRNCFFGGDKKFEHLVQKLTSDYETFQKTKQTMEEAITEIGQEFLRQENEVALVVTGATLQHALHTDLESTFLDLALSCKAVVCCRVSPMQKAMIVELVKKNCQAITLAIGDGANDVSMIQAAHVGVGISGQEGLQAANSSDYSIAQFCYLQKLLLVHGAWNYNRLTKCILFSFYKNICLYLIELWFAFYNGFSGQILFDRWTISFYNVFFTALPPFTLGLFERTCSSKVMLKYPQLYSISQSASKYNAKVFWAMFLNATIHSLMLFYMPAFSLYNEIAFSNGQVGGYLFLGNFVYTFTVFTVCLKAGLESSTWTILTHIAVWGSFAIWLIFFGVYSHVFSILPLGAEMLGQADIVMSSPVFWLGMLLVPPSVLFRDLLWKVFRRRFRKSVVEEVQEMEMENIDPQKTILAAARQSLSEKAHLLKNMFGMGNGSLRSLQDTNHGYAFSQEEGGVVSQSDLIRQYNTAAQESS
uniref:Phospholipid-transporting ATPase n=1 Tax=Ciona savignyi TaxID=51511 RepID=H2ZKG8_CIOSA